MNGMPLLSFRRRRNIRKCGGTRKYREKAFDLSHLIVASSVTQSRITPGRRSKMIRLFFVAGTASKHTFYSDFDQTASGIDYIGRLIDRARYQICHVYVTPKPSSTRLMRPGVAQIPRRRIVCVHTPTPTSMSTISDASTSLTRVEVIATSVRGSGCLSKVPLT